MRSGSVARSGSMDLGIKDLRVLVTAGAGGIGLEIARAFVREGARVHICDVDEAALAAAKKSDPQLTQSVCDVADRAQVAKLFDDALKALGGLDCLVNNAGIAGPTGKVEEINPEDWDRCLAIDITGQFNCVRLAVPHLKQSKNPSIMNLSSQAGKHGFPLRSAYAAAKWGVIGFTKSIAIELGGLRHPRQRAAARPRRRRPHPPRHRGQGPAGRHLVQGAGGGAVRATSPSRTTSRPSSWPTWSSTPRARAPRPSPARPSRCAATRICWGKVSGRQTLRV